MRIFGQTDQEETGPGVPTMVTIVVSLYMLGWLAYCTAFELNAVTTTGRIVDHEVLRHRRDGVLLETVKVEIRYEDAAGVTHEVREDFYGRVPEDGRIPVRYALHRPQDGRLEGFWPVWGLWSMTAGVLLLYAGLMKVALARRGLDWDGRPAKRGE
ncbi:MAG: DUF3592 domain-containing protein [Opitutales bacterium]